MNAPAITPQPASPPASGYSDKGTYTDIDQIEVPPRIGFYWPEKALAIGKLMAADGQMTPISVRPNGPNAALPYRLVAGLHRLRGAAMVGLKTIRFEEEFGGVDRLRKIEASENWDRRDLGPIEKAMFARALVDIAEAEYIARNSGLTPQQVAARNRWVLARSSVATRAPDLANLEAEVTRDIMSHLIGWTEECAAAMDMSLRSLQRYLLIHRQICGLVTGTQDEIERQTQGWLHKLARHPLGEKFNSVMDISKIVDDKARRAVIDYICDHPDVDSVENAKIGAKIADAKIKAPAEGQTKFMNNAQANLSRLSAASWKSWAPALAQEIKPSALMDVRDAIDARIAALGGHAALTAKGEA